MKSTNIDCSIIVPVLNEQANILNCMDDLKQAEQLGQTQFEVIFVDGGSQDDTCSLIVDNGFTLLKSARGRATQMNTGAAAAVGDVLVFLHADTRVGADYFDGVVKAAQADYGWGRFNVSISGEQVMFKVIANLINWRSRFSRVATGDQMIWVNRELFCALNGYADIPLMEDVELSKRLRSQANMCAHRQSVETSGRRWLKFGIWKTIVLMWSLRFDYWRGVCPEKLAQRYR